MPIQNKKSSLVDKKKNKEYYSQSDGHFMDFESAFFAHKVLDRVAWVRENVHRVDSRTHIDVGSKDGYLGLTLESEGVACIGIDPSKDAIGEAKNRAMRKDLDTTFLVGFAEDIPKGIEADTVSCLEVIEHVIDPEALIRKLVTLGKLIMISTPDANGRHGKEDMDRNEEHLRIYTENELVELIDRYGDIVEVALRDDQICISFSPK